MLSWVFLSTLGCSPQSPSPLQGLRKGHTDNKARGGGRTGAGAQHRWPLLVKEQKEEASEEEGVALAC